MVKKDQGKKKFEEALEELEKVVEQLESGELSLEDAVRGTEVRIRVPAMEKCDACQGSGAKVGTSSTVCRTCGGHRTLRS